MPDGRPCCPSRVDAALRFSSAVPLDRRFRRTENADGGHSSESLPGPLLLPPHASADDSQAPADRHLRPARSVPKRRRTLRIPKGGEQRHGCAEALQGIIVSSTRHLRFRSGADRLGHQDSPGWAAAWARAARLTTVPITVRSRCERPNLPKLVSPLSIPMPTPILISPVPNRWTISAFQSRQCC